MTAAAAAASRGLNDDVVTEILLRLPSADVLRFRAVCKAWYRITTSPVFIASHAARRPLELIVQRRDASDVLDTIPVATIDETTRRRLDVRYPGCTASKKWIWTGYILLASCDGLLLFDKYPTTPGQTKDHDHLVCNPVTRQWTMLPRLPSTITRAVGFYVHPPSGEHRVLFFTNNDQQVSHYVYSLDDAEARRLEPVRSMLNVFINTWFDVPLCPSLNHDGKVHWLWEASFSDEVDATREILAFDTVSEMFRRISGPPIGWDKNIILLEIEGMLAMTGIAHGSMDIWVLEDYNNDKSWSRRFRVHLPPPLHDTCWAINADVDEQTVILFGEKWTCTAVLYNLTEKRVLNQFKLVTEDDRSLTRLDALVFRESLVRHAFFEHQEPQYVHTGTPISVEVDRQMSRRGRQRKRRATSDAKGGSKKLKKS